MADDSCSTYDNAPTAAIASGSSSSGQLTPAATNLTTAATGVTPSSSDLSRQSRAAATSSDAATSSSDSSNQPRAAATSSNAATSSKQPRAAATSSGAATSSKQPRAAATTSGATNAATSSKDGSKQPRAAATSSGAATSSEQPRAAATSSGAPDAATSSKQQQITRDSNQMLVLVNDLFDNELSPHSFYHCVHAHPPCNFIKSKGRKQFDHKWIPNRELTFDEETGIWWLVFIPDEGMYCVLCRLHQTQNTKNKLQKSYGLEPAVGMQSDALQEHARSTRHRNSVEAEMIQRVSVFQKKLDERKNCN